MPVQGELIGTGRQSELYLLFFFFFLDLGLGSKNSYTQTCSLKYETF